MKIIRMDSTILECVDSCVDSSRPLLHTIGDSDFELNESQFDLKEEENDENELCTFSLELVKKNKRLIEESKKLTKQLVSSKYELREKEEVINCVDSKFMISSHNLSIIQDELNELMLGCDELNHENLNLRDKLKKQDKRSRTWI